MNDDEKIKRVEEFVKLWNQAADANKEYEIVTVKDVCNILGVSRYTVYRLVDSNTLTAIQHSPGATLKFTRKAIDDYLLRSSNG